MKRFLTFEPLVEIIQDVLKILTTCCDKNDFVLDFEVTLCPNNQVLKYSITKRQEYREYKSNSKICSKCEYDKQCIQSKNHTKIVTRHVWKIYRGSRRYKTSNRNKRNI